MHKLSETDVREIRSRYEYRRRWGRSGVKMRELAAEFDVSISCISRVLSLNRCVPYDPLVAYLEPLSRMLLIRNKWASK